MLSEKILLNIPKLKKWQLNTLAIFFMEPIIYEEEYVQYMLEDIPYKVTQEYNDSILKPVTEE